jgi:hypothetical protein
LQERLEHFRKVAQEHSALLTLLDQIIALAFIRTNVHFEYAYDQVRNERSAGRSADEPTAYYLQAGYFLSERACYTAEAMSCLLWHGYADAAYENWRSLHHIALNLGEMSRDETEETAERYLSAALAEMYHNEGRIREAGAPSIHSDAMWDRMQNLIPALTHQYGNEIARLDGWVKDPSNRKPRDRAKSLDLLAEHEMFYEEASKLAHAGSVSMLKRPSVGPENIADFHSVLTARPSTIGIPRVASLAAAYVHGIVQQYIDGTEQFGVVHDSQWEADAVAMQEQLATMVGVAPDSTHAE